ncbi:MAG: class I SAM-dependent methyltransferase, partial [Anaerolineae bacterium]|nr:class I SAM-dependent methyltransferase [Anaerolineae bacterium]
MLSEGAAKNRRYWDGISDEYQAQHAPQLNEKPLAWGVWAVPESDLHILGDVAGKDVLEFGCGAAQWSIFLAQRGARPVGVDNSARQLEHARRLMVEAGVDFPLVHAS